MGVLFLVLSGLLVVEVITLGGWLLVRWVPVLRSGAVVTALILSAVALIQGFRAPVVKDYEVRLPGLSKDRDGLVLVHLSDLHLGSLIGERWLRRLITQVESLRPDLVVVTGDLVDGNVAHVEPLIPVLKKLHAPLGVWAVTGNHEFYAGLERSLVILDEAGWTVLRDRNVEVAPGLILAGVDDLTARQQWRLAGQPVQQALDHRRLGATILLSHSPWQVEAAAQAGAGLMLSGHTHAGQIWPFTYLVQHRYPRIAGRYHVDGMTLIVSRGTGTWGPRMRLWHRGEIIRIRLRAGA